MLTGDFRRPAVDGAGIAAGPGDSQRLVIQGGNIVRQCATLTGWEVFEHMVLYCLTLNQAKDGICAFYIDDFPSCDEYTLRVVQRLMGQCVTRPAIFWKSRRSRTKASAALANEEYGAEGKELRLRSHASANH